MLKKLKNFKTVIGLSLVSIFLCILTFLAFINPKLLSFSDDNLQTLLLIDVFLLILFFIPAETKVAVTDGTDDVKPLVSVDRSSVRVLLAEDHPLLRPMLLEAMTVAGFDVRATSSAEEALRMDQDWRASVLVLDVNLPGATGDMVAESIRTRRAQNVPVIFITGNNEFEMPDWPNVELLRKPFGLSDLMESIDRHARG